MRVARMLALVVGASLSLAASAPVTFGDLATPFERVAVATVGLPEAERIAAVRRAIDPLLPGVYPADATTDRRIATALAEFPERRLAYDRVVRDFPGVLARAVARFRTVFPGFTAPMPIFLYHSLGVRDGGSDTLEPGGRPVMLFGADAIARYHGDTSLEPFFAHELFHLEHAHAFAACDPFWCRLWQEGLAVAAAATMNPGATDHELLLDQPLPIRAPTDAHWGEALCFVAAHFDDTDPAAQARAMDVSGKPTGGLPDRFGYYVGYRLATATRATIPSLDRLEHRPARRLLRATLIRLMTEAKTSCPYPARTSPDTP